MELRRHLVPDVPRGARARAGSHSVIVAIDGPAGAGKSTVARAVARRLGFAHMDTGAMYRAVTLAHLESGLDLDDADRLQDSIATMDVALDTGAVTWEGRDVTARLRTRQITAAVSSVAAQPAVRAALVPLQKRLAERGDVVVEGRDIGTVVFPDADVKIYLTASPAERARRRARQLGLEQDDVTLESLSDELGTRDRTDASRALSPLHAAEDAHRIDSTHMSQDEVVQEVVALVRARAGKAGR